MDLRRFNIGFVGFQHALKLADESGLHVHLLLGDGILG
jgi:hypothetical protein